MDITLIFSKNKPFFMMVAICMGAFVSHFTAGVVNVSLPHLSKVFHTNLGTVQWITVGYLLAIATRSSNSLSFILIV
ncbi:hypothetical protein JOC86_001903 [Bacillus pakistanensis]|uniref:MFS transporter n=1 Tax=Rossellomorea pakistanensis TaxID=992288 RepID=A0ABS2NBX2_9BACI|nr:hypothetical protein [Bacillus pakistanensis]